MDADVRLLTALDEAARTRAFTRFALLKPHLEDGVPLTRLAAAQGTPLRTLQRWLQAYRRQGLAGLVRRSRADRDRRRFPAKLVQLVEGLTLRKPPPSAATVQRQVVAIAAERGRPRPSYSTVYAVVRRLDPALLTLAHDGAAGYRETFDLLYRREGTRPNEVWQADHTPLDLWILDEQGRPARPWLTVIMDDYSRAVAAYRLSLDALLRRPNPGRAPGTA